MKIIGIYSVKNVGDNVSSGLGMMVWPDSAFIRTGKPLFIPEGENFRLFITYSIRIDRLGKGVQTKFAERYYKEVAPIAVLLPGRAADALSESFHPYATDIVKDCSVVVGDYIPKEEAERSKVLEGRIVSFVNNDIEAAFRVSLEDFRSAADEAVKFASSANTLKTGDILIPNLSTENFAAVTDSIVSVTIDGRQLLKFKLK